ncbi:MAG: hypothetical protein JWQ19_495 [Subtercola sp.]|nr:hypothetical protein [Subtercola sp.]
MVVAGGRVTFIVGEGDEFESATNIDAIVSIGSSRFSATFLTLDAVGTIMARHATSGESASGGYLFIPDLIVTKCPGIPSMVAAIEDLISHGEAPGMRLPAADQLE